MSYEAEQQNRKNRALYQSMKIIKYDKGKQTAIIRSSKYDNYYTVTPYSCTCPDFQKRGEPCKHIYKLQNYISGGEQVDNTVVKEKPPKTTAVFLDKPDISYIVIGIIVLIVAFFLSGSSIPAGVVVALFGVYSIYCYIAFKRRPDNPKYITAEQMECWRQLISSDKKTVHDLQKASLPVLLELKSRVQNYYQRLSAASTPADIEKFSELLLTTQQKIVDISEFVIIAGDEPKAYLDSCWDYVEELRN